ncbi:MAG: VCBS repeat-containing protein, partial [Thermoplasmata archaeon]|nr:VCBS repeat-containing protein [Thermoplasmata archaeon]
MRGKLNNISVVLVTLFLISPIGIAANIVHLKVTNNATKDDSETLTYKITFSPPNLKEINIFNRTFTTISMAGCINTGEAGKPALPVYGTRILLPYGTQLEGVTVEGEREEIIIKEIDLKEKPIFPYQHPIPIGYGRPEFIIDEEAYNSQNFSKLFDVVGVHYCRGYAILTMNLYPIEYYPKIGELFYYKYLTIRIELKKTGYVNEFFRNNPLDREWVKTLVMNPEILDTYTVKTAFEYPGGICNPSEHYDYVIITREALVDFTATYNWSDFISRKESEGLETTIVTVEEIEACQDYWDTEQLFNDTAAKIREFCKDAYIDWGTQYILIAGDNDGPNMVPRRLLHYGTGSSQEDVDSDLYWSNLDGTFNDDHDSQWGESDDTGFDLYSELFIGSIPCDEGIDISNWLTKSFYYADATDRDYLENVAFYGGDLDGWATWYCEGDDFMDFTLYGTDNWLGPDPNHDGPWPSWLGFLYGFDTWNSSHPGMEFNTSVRWTAEGDDPEDDGPNPGWQGGSESVAIAGMRDAINNDLCTIINGIAHANEHMSLDVYDSEWESSYHNTMPFFIHDYGCHCGDMDATDDGVLHSMLFHSDTELAFACVYNTGYGWGNTYCTNSSSALQQKLFWDYMFNWSKCGGTANWRLGKAQAYSKDAMAPTINWDPGYETWRGIIESCTLFGDPAQLIKPPELLEHNIGVIDLEVEDHVNPSDTVYINATIANTGKNNETNIIVSCRVNGTEIDNLTIPFLASQSSQEVSFTWVPTRGWYNVAVNVSIPGVSENLTADNEKSKVVVAGSDVAVSSIKVPTFAAVDSITEIKATIANLGTNNEVVDVNLIVNGATLDTISLIIEGKHTQSIAMLWNPVYEGEYQVKIEAKCSGDVYSENNWRIDNLNVTAAKGYILLVDDDNGDDYETYFENALMATGYLYELWDRSSQGCPTPSYMAKYTAVVWFTGDDYTSTLTTEDENALSTYLDNGGRLFITGQDIGYDIHDDGFYSNYLHAEWLVDDTEIYTLNGIAGGPIGDNLTIVITSGDGADNQYWPDGINPIGGATPVFQYANSSYYGGIKYEGTYKVVYFAFGFEAINSMDDRTEVMQRIMNWLGGGANVSDIYLNPLNLDYIVGKGQTIYEMITVGNAVNASANLTFNISLQHGFTLQWVHQHGGDGHSQLAQPVGDFDEDGINEFLIGGYGSGGTYIYSYDTNTKDYVQEHFWTYPGGSYNVPSGACVVDLDDDGDLEFVVSWEYSGEDGIHAYDWDGANLTELDWYTGIGYDFAFDVYACDYDDDGDVEVLIANEPSDASGYHVTALAWNNTASHFEREISWGSGEATECPMVWSGDTDGDGKTEVIASAGSNTVYALNYENGTWAPDAVATGLPAHPYGVACGDLDGDGIDEIAFGLDSTDAYIYKWNSSTDSYQQVWHHNYAGEDDIIEGIAIGDVNNDGDLELVVGPTYLHIIKWNGTAYEEIDTITETQGMLAGVNVGDFDTDGYNEVKACDILSNVGKEWIFDYVKEPDWIEVIPREGVLQPSEEMNISITIYTENLSENFTRQFIQIDTNDPDESLINVPLYISLLKEITFNFTLFSGWNLITIPVENNLTAKSLIENITGCNVVYAWDA